jgi:hypothetical protein
MNRAILFFLILAVSCFGAEPDKATTKDLTDLISSLPVREQLVADVSLFKNAAPPNEKQSEATERLKKAKDGFERLKPLLRTGTSVFDYPGLIALARPRHDDLDNTYEMLLGIPPGWNWNHPQGTNPGEYRITFDRRGIITAIEPVIYKH